MKHELLSMNRSKFDNFIWCQNLKIKPSIKLNLFLGYFAISPRSTGELKQESNFRCPPSQRRRSIQFQFAFACFNKQLEREMYGGTINNVKERKVQANIQVLGGAWIQCRRLNYKYFEIQMDAEAKQTQQLLSDRAKLIELIYKLLEDILATTSDMPKGNSKFHAKQIPAMSVRDYLSRISKYSHCSNASYVMALIYIDRLQDCLEQLVINKYCIHKLLLTSIVLAAKYNDDEFYKNVYYAKVGGISIDEMNMLEKTFSTILDYNFFVRPEDFNTYLQKLTAYDVINE